MNDYEQARLIVLDYAMDLLEPEFGMMRSHFERASFSKWAIDEILYELKKKRYLSPNVVIKNFAAKMYKYSKTDSDFRFMFSIAYDVASDIYEIFRSMKMKNI